MKKLLLLTLLLAACQTQPVKPVPAEPALQSYQSADYGISFQYPGEWLNKASDSSYSSLENVLVVLELPKETYPGTNFSDASFSVNVQYAESLEACLALSSIIESIETFEVNRFETVNGVTYYTVNGGGAAAGNTYDSKYSRAYVDDNCFEIVQTLHTTNIGNYDPGTVTEVNENEVWERLDDIFQTFTF